MGVKPAIFISYCVVLEGEEWTAPVRSFSGRDAFARASNFQHWLEGNRHHSIAKEALPDAALRKASTAKICELPLEIFL